MESTINFSINYKAYLKIKHDSTGVSSNTELHFLANGYKVPTVARPDVMVVSAEYREEPICMPSL